MLSEESVRVLSVVLPRLRGWMADVVQTHEPRSHLALDLVPDSVAACFPADFLQSARVAVVDEVPTPPFRDFGLPEMSPLGDGPLDGITLDDFYFVKSDSERPDLHVHELVHVAQCCRLGPANFLLTYGVGFSLYGYRDSPLESLAHHLQLEFLRGLQRPDLIGDIERHAEAAWEAARLCLALASLKGHTRALRREAFHVLLEMKGRHGDLFFRQGSGCLTNPGLQLFRIQHPDRRGIRFK